MSSHSSTSEGNGRAAETRPGLKRSMGLWMATALVIGNMIGSGVFLLPAAMAGTAGPVSVVAWLFTGIGAMLLALVFATSGAPTRRPAGRTPTRARPSATSSASRPRGATGSTRGSGTRQSRSPSPATSLSSGAAAPTNWLAVLVAIALIWILTLVNILGVREAGIVQVVTTILKFVPLLVIGVVGLFFMDSGNFEPFALERLRLGHQRRSASDPVGLYRPGVGDRPGRGGQGSRADDPAGDHHRHGRCVDRLPHRNAGALRDDRQFDARQLDQPLRRRRERHLRRDLVARPSRSSR